ncbi:hypothetical protein NQZ68_026977 [Dissostichus eleginoides]|nr:hypothetical protein NQZ68_026977 [Dissostichus eleginoides]
MAIWLDFYRSSQAKAVAMPEAPVNEQTGQDLRGLGGGGGAGNEASVPMQGGCQLYTQQTSVTCCHQREAQATGVEPSLAASGRALAPPIDSSAGRFSLHAEVSTDTHVCTVIVAGAPSQANV